MRIHLKTECNLKSRIFIGKVNHIRTRPIKYSLSLNHFMFFLDLDDLNGLDNFFPLLSYKRRGVFNFKKKDHYIFSKDSLKDHFKEITKKDIHKIFFLTNLRIFGYVFNPISVFFCFDKSQNLSSVIYEVGNTFKEQKIFDKSIIKDNTASLKTKKLFYVSPFIPLDVVFNFFSKINNKEKTEELTLQVDSIQNDSKIISILYWL